MIRTILVDKPGFLLRVTDTTKDGMIECKLQNILSKICAVSGYDRSDICGLKREEPLIYWRMAFTYICCKKTTATLKNIGKIINRHHSTVINQRDVFIDLLEAKDRHVMEIYPRIINIF